MNSLQQLDIFKDTNDDVCDPPRPYMLWVCTRAFKNRFFTALGVYFVPICIRVRRKNIQKQFLPFFERCPATITAAISTEPSGTEMHYAIFRIILAVRWSKVTAYARQEVGHSLQCERNLTMKK